MIPRFHCPFPLSPGAQVDLPEAAGHHALKVLRLRPGDAVMLFDGQGGEWQAEIVGAGRTARVALRAHLARECETPLHVTLVQALPAGDKMDWVVEKAVELGVAAIQPVAAQRSVIRLSAERMARRVAHWNAIAAAACAQCGRNRVPPVAAVLDLPRYLGGLGAADGIRLMLAPQAATGLASLPPPNGAIRLLVGPESGWTDDEIQAAQLVGFRTLRLGPRVLRCETAGLAALAALQTRWGDLAGE